MTYYLVAAVVCLSFCSLIMWLRVREHDRAFRRAERYLEALRVWIEAVAHSAEENDQKLYELYLKDRNGHHSLQ